jgi:HEAT repeat protein
MHWWHLQKLKFKDAKARLSALQKLCEEDSPVTLEILISLFADADKDIRKIAAAESVKFRDAQAFRPLVRLLSDREPEVREAAIGALRQLGDASVVPMLEPLLKDSDSRVRYRAAVALDAMNWSPRTPELSAYHAVALGKPDRAAYHGAAAVDALVYSMQSSVSYKRQEIIEVLSHIDDPRVVKPLIAMLRDVDANVRTNAVEALGRIADARAADPLIATLKDKDNRVRAAAVESLGKIGDAKAVQPLAKLLNDDSWNVRMAAVQGLGKFKDASVIDAVVKCLKDKDRDLRQAAALSIGMIGHPRAIPALVSIMVDEQESVRNAAGMALRMIDAEWERSDLVKMAIPGLQDAAKSPVYWVRQSALAVLARLGLQDAGSAHKEPEQLTDASQARRLFAFDVLVTALRDQDRDLRHACADALGRFGDRRATNPLVSALDDPDEWVRTAAANSLQSMRWEPTDNEQQAKHLVILHHWEEAVRLRAAAVEPFIVTLQSASRAARAAAARALAKIGEGRAKVPLQELLRDPHYSVRIEAAKALKSLQWISPDPELHAIQLVALGAWDEVLQLGSVAVEPLAQAAGAVVENPADAEVALSLLGRMDDPASLGKLLVHVHDDRLSGVIILAIEAILTNRMTDVSDENLRAIAGMVDPLQSDYETEPQSRSRVRTNTRTIECDHLRLLALQELHAREDATRTE